MIATDVIGILDALGVKQARVVGHDWGAALDWYLALTRPDRIERIVAMSVGANGNSGASALAQREKSWYSCSSSSRASRKTTLMRNDWAFFKEWSRGQGDTDRYVKDLSRPGALTAALNWYRANVRPQMPVENPAAPPKIAVPAMGHLGRRRSVSHRGSRRKSPERLSGSWRYEKIAGAGHWIMLDKPAEVNRSAARSS